MSSTICRIDAIADQIRGVTYRKQDASTVKLEGFLPVLRAGNITDEGLTYDDLVYVPSSKIATKQKVKKGDIVIAASSGSIDVVGKAAPALEDFEGGFGAFCKVLRPRKKVDAAYFAHFFKTPEYRRRISFLSAGANINNLRNDDLNSLEIPLPPLAEQKRIAAILDAADALRAKRRESLVQLDTLLQSTFLDMFGDPGTNPRGWQARPISVFCRTGSGGTPPRRNAARYYTGGTIPWVKSGELREALILSTEEYVTEIALQETSIKMVPAGALLLAMYGATVGRLGLLGVDATTNQAVCHIVPDTSVADTLYLFHALAAQVPQIINRGVGGAQPNISQSIIKGLFLPLPPLEKQRYFATIVQSVEQQKVRFRSHLAELDTLFAVLQQRAFNGEL